ncbi:MAG: translation initiation factor IF-3 [Candidatus Wildermuthbacteria bacterium]|nr:translation initiation factor IF-3 [Candidatus Wildermuthbacteria bacterium]
MIDETGKQMGVLPLQDALKAAQEKNLDLIQVTDKVVPPVCKLGDYGKYLYQLQKKERHEKKSTGGELKEIRLTFNISTHDMETRANQAIKFLGRGDKVRITVRLRGREKALRAFTEEKIRSFLAILETKIPLKIEQKLQVEPRGLSMIITKK